MLADIAVSIILPIFALIGIGTLLDRAFRLDLPTLSKLNFYVFVPALVFLKILDADLPGGTMAKVAVFSVAHLALLYAVVLGVTSAGPLRQHRTVLSLGALFFNAGNYGLPLVLLAFGDSQVGVLAVILMVQNLASFTFGVWLLERKARGAGQVLAGLMRVSVVPAILVAVLLRALHLPLPAPVRTPLTYLGNGLIPIALLTLGVQLARNKRARQALTLGSVGLLRLVASPLLAAALIPLFGFAPPVSPVLIVTAGLPVAVNVYILAVEYRQDEELASQAVFWTTLLSAITLSLLLVLVR